MTNSTNKSLYIHIPFCEHLCPYCDFTKLFYLPKFSKPYLESLFKEIDSYKLSDLETIYIGGGTPTSLSDEEFESLLKKVSPLLKSGGEFTCEANVENLTKEKLSLMASYGVNRLSIGIQSTHDERLAQIGRFHSFEKAQKVIQLAREIGFKNINVDLMYGFPNQNIDEVISDVKNIIALNTEHVSIYSLIVSPGTLFFSKNIKEQNSDESRQFYDTILSLMREAGFERYEISNFSKPGYESRHNLVYWHNQEYFGVGLGASGYLNNVRYTNTKSLKKYILGQYIDEKEELTPQLLEEDYLLTHLRLKDGFSLDEYQKLFHVKFDEKYSKLISSLNKNKYAIITPNSFYLTDDGLMIMDAILLDFYKLL